MSYISNIINIIKYCKETKDFTLLMKTKEKEKRIIEIGIITPIAILKLLRYTYFHFGIFPGNIYNIITIQIFING